MTATVDRSIAYRVAWRDGRLSYLMTRTQREVARLMAAATSTIFVLRCTRRFGKTYMLAILVFIQAIRKPGSVIRYIAPSKLAGRQFVIPAFEWVASFAPQECRPRFDGQDNCWRWRNGSVCHLGSAETMRDVERMVGTACDLALLDECGKYPTGILNHLIRSVLRPQFLTTRGRIFMASTPPLSRAHDFTAWCAMAAERGAIAQYTIDDVDHVSREAIEELIADNGGPDSADTRRELYCEDVVDEAWAIVPEFAKHRASIVREFTVPEWRDVYTVVDFGFHDLTFALFMSYDFERAKILIEDELVFHHKSGLEVGAAVLAHEKRLWGEHTRPNRYADIPEQSRADLAHPTLGPGIAFAAVAKVDSAAALNRLRMSLGNLEIEIHPRCKALIAHLEYGTWNQSRTSFDRAEGYGHWDGIDALKYAVRHVNRKRNPMPDIIPERRGRVDVAQPRTVSQRRPLSAAMRVGSTVRTS